MLLENAILLFEIGTCDQIMKQSILKALENGIGNNDQPETNQANGQAPGDDAPSGSHDAAPSRTTANDQCQREIEAEIQRLHRLRQFCMQINCKFLHFSQE